MSKKENCNRHSFANYDDDDNTAASSTCHVVAHCTCKYTMDTQEQAHSFCTQFKEGKWQKSQKKKTHSTF